VGVWDIAAMVTCIDASAIGISLVVSPIRADSWPRAGRPYRLAR
jgi:hypothetical protein